MLAASWILLGEKSPPNFFFLSQGRSTGFISSRCQHQNPHSSRSLEPSFPLLDNFKSFTGQSTANFVSTYSGFLSFRIFPLPKVSGTLRYRAFFPFSPSGMFFFRTFWQPSLRSELTILSPPRTFIRNFFPPPEFSSPAGVFSLAALFFLSCCQSLRRSFARGIALIWRLPPISNGSFLYSSELTLLFTNQFSCPTASFSPFLPLFWHISADSPNRSPIQPSGPRFRCQHHLPPPSLDAHGKAFRVPRPKNFPIFRLSRVPSHRFTNSFPSSFPATLTPKNEFLPGELKLTRKFPPLCTELAPSDSEPTFGRFELVPTFQIFLMVKLGFLPLPPIRSETIL